MSRNQQSNNYDQSDGLSYHRYGQPGRYTDNRRTSDGRGAERRRDSEYTRSPTNRSGRYDQFSRDGYTDRQHRTDGAYRAHSYPSTPSHHQTNHSRDARSKDYPAPRRGDLRHRLDFSSEPVRNERHEIDRNGNGNDDNEEARWQNNSFDGVDRSSPRHRSDEEDFRDGIEVEHVYHPDDPRRPDKLVSDAADCPKSDVIPEANSLAPVTPQPSASQEDPLPPASEIQDPPEEVATETMELDEVAPIVERPTLSLSSLGCGFVNSQSIYCYFNSVIQVLFRSPFFVILLALLSDLLVVKSRFISTLIAKCESFQRSTGRSMELAALRRQVFSLDNFKKFERVNHNDPHEFLMLLFDSLAQEVAPAFKSEGTFVDSSFLNNFAYLIRDTRCCKHCGHLSHMDEIQYSLALRCEHPGKQSLEELLKEYFTDEEVERRCDECKVGQFATKSKVLLRPPAQLVCYVATHYTDDATKIISQVSPQMSLDLSTIGVSEPPQALHFALMLKNNLGLTEAVPATPMRSDVRERYQLSAVICHKGEKNSSGHYIAVVLDRSSQRWFCYNDAQVTQVDESELFSAEWTPVLFFYHLASEDSRVGIKPKEADASFAKKVQDLFAKVQREEDEWKEEKRFLEDLFRQDIRQKEDNFKILIEKLRSHSNLSQSSTASNVEKRKLSDSTNNYNEGNVPGKKVKI